MREVCSQEVKDHVENLQRVVSLTNRWNEVTVDEFQEYNELSQSSFLALSGMGRVLAEYERSRRVEDFTTLPNEWTPTTVSETEDGVTFEFKISKKLRVISAPLVYEEGIICVLNFPGDFSPLSVLSRPYKNHVPKISFMEV